MKAIPTETPLQLKPYQKPQILFVIELETRAGSPLSPDTGAPDLLGTGL